MDTKQLMELGKQLVIQGEERGVTLRILGHLAVRDHVQDHYELLDLLERVPTHDIDFMGYSKEMAAAESMFLDLGYEPDPSVAFSQEYGVQRLIYHHRENDLSIQKASISRAIWAASAPRNNSSTTSVLRFAVQRVPFSNNGSDNFSLLSQTPICKNFVALSRGAG